MTTSLRTIRAKMSRARQERIRKRTKESLKELHVQDLRQARALSQEELADMLGLNQATISKLPRGESSHPAVRGSGGGSGGAEGVGLEGSHRT